ncbi:MAG: DUF928 domain-containing protein [Cyanobacteria bacterium P01_A01_bin.17]
MKTQIQQTSKVTVLMLGISILLQGIPSWAAFNPKNKKLRRPGNRQAAATRPICRADNNSLQKSVPDGPPLTALVPQTKQQLSKEFTTAAYPTFHWYMPTNNPHPAAQFTLYKVTNIEPVIEQAEVFSTRFQITNEAGVASFKLPAEAMVSALEMNQDYHWQINLLCLNEDDEYVTNQYAEGWITRIQRSSELTQKLAQAKPTAQIDIFAEEGLWYDALTHLTTLRQNYPKRKSLERKWKSLLSSEHVQLSEIPSRIVSPPK